MEKLAIKLEYNDKLYISDFDIFSEDQKAKLYDLITSAAGGRLSYLKFSCGNTVQFFPESVLKESIIGIIHNKENK